MSELIAVIDQTSGRKRLVRQATLAELAARARSSVRLVWAFAEAPTADVIEALKTIRDETDRRIDDLKGGH